jgi:cyanate permease
MIMWKRIVQPGKPHMAMWRKHIAYWIPKATNTHSGYVVLIAFSLQQWLHERSSLLRYIILPVLSCYLRTPFQLQMLFMPRKIVGCFVGVMKLKG